MAYTALDLTRRYVLVEWENDDTAGCRFHGIPITRLADSSRRQILGSILGGSLGLPGLKHVADAAALKSRAKCKKIKNKKRRRKCLAKIIALPPQEQDPKAPDQPLPPADPVTPSPPPPSPAPNHPIPTNREVHLPVRAAFYYP